VPNAIQAEEKRLREEAARNADAQIGIHIT